VAGQLLRGGAIKLFFSGKPVASCKALGLLAANPGDGLQIGADTVKPVGDYEPNHDFAGLIAQVKVTFGEVAEVQVAKEARAVAVP
jgi:hypothetical protein